jgi:hypothetical protein
MCMSVSHRANRRRSAPEWKVSESVDRALGADKDCFEGSPASRGSGSGVLSDSGRKIDLVTLVISFTSTHRTNSGNLPVLLSGQLTASMTSRIGRSCKSPHYCRAISKTESAGWRNHSNSLGSRTAEVPVEWAFSRKCHAQDL